MGQQILRLTLQAAIFPLLTRVVQIAGSQHPILGEQLLTLKDAIAWLAKKIPKSEHAMPKVQTAARMVTEAAENNGPMIFAQMGMLQAIHRHHMRELDSSRKTTPLG
jgi:hypothetical protein